MREKKKGRGLRGQPRVLNAAGTDSDEGAEAESVGRHKEVAT